MKAISTLARPYAQAAFNFAQVENVLEKWSLMLNDLSMLISNTHFKMLINNPNISYDELIQLIFSIMSEELDEHTKNFIRLVIQNDRLLLLPDIAARFSALYNQYKKQCDVNVTSAFELTDSQKKRFTEALEKRLSLKVKLSCQVDKTILGGAIVRAGDRVLNYSGKYLINELANDLRGKN